MKNSICKFMQPYQPNNRVEPLRFVYETEIQALKQPFMDAVFHFNIVMSGSARLTLCNMEYFLMRGCVFFTYPGFEYRISDFDDFTYTYIAFTGKEAYALLEPLGIAPEAPVFRGLEFLCGYFDETIRRLTDNNSSLLTESALFYALAFIADINGKGEEKKRSENLYGSIIDYVNRNFCDRNMSLTTLSNIYSYSPKYISSLIKSNLKIGFSAYLNELRIKKAKSLMDKCEGSISDIALASGFTDPLYFSKVFKKTVGTSPSEYMKSTEDNPERKLLKKYL